MSDNFVTAEVVETPPGESPPATEPRQSSKDDRGATIFAYVLLAVLVVFLASPLVSLIEVSGVRWTVIGPLTVRACTVVPSTLVMTASGVKINIPLTRSKSTIPLIE